MSTSLPNEWRDAVRDDPDLSPAAKLIIHELRCYMNNGRIVAWPSLRSIAQKTSLDRSTVTRQLNALEEAGYLERKRGGKGQSTRYFLAFPGPKIGPTDRCTMHPPRCTVQHRVGAQCDTNKQVNKQYTNKGEIGGDSIVDFPDRNWGEE